MANYTNRSSKHDAKGKGKVGASGLPPVPVPVPVPVLVSFTGMVSLAALSAETTPSASEIPSAGKSVPSTVGTEVTPAHSQNVVV
jgi:hypothetical protein